MPYVDQYISVTQAKNRLLDLVRGLKHRQEVLAITRDGIPAAVLLSMEQYDGLMETIDLLTDQKTMRSLKRSLRQVQDRQWVSDEVVFGHEKK